ncbi:kinase-like protein [Pisolithus marmoratus]|nr:kinase-like protein [Pisolithus marmoratus]
MDVTFGGKYRLEEEIANGGCGSVFLGVHTVAGKEVAIKLEPALPHALTSPLKQESKVYKSLMGGPGVPWILYSGKQGDYNVMVIDLLGPSLEDLFKRCNRHFSLRTVLLLADQLLSRLEFIHSRSFVHRDVKPANFVMGLPHTATSHLVNVIDFGLARRYRDPLTGDHAPWRRERGERGERRHGVGTSLFASLNAHRGIECSRRDDLESLAYMLIYFCVAHCPGQPRTPRKARSSSVHPAGTPPTHRCARTPSSAYPAGSSTYSPAPSSRTGRRASAMSASCPLTMALPREFHTLLAYARSLRFIDLPDYVGLRDMFRTLGARTGITDAIYACDGRGEMDWECGRGWSTPSRRSSSSSRSSAQGRGRTARVCEACNAAALASGKQER